jgi:2-amino-4-hydroxy-6-hydroxymethyldihydropteridine diphosphokinase
MSGAARSSLPAGLSRVAIALGSNLGDRESHLAFAIDRLRRYLTDLRVSTWHETEPVGVEPQPQFLNGALTGNTQLTARELLQELMEIEQERGRERPRAGAPRTLDLDLILYGDEVIAEPALRVPHPRFRERMFVLEPLSEIAGHWIDPETGRTVNELLNAKLLEADGRA